jgi:hypothetical protein
MHSHDHDAPKSMRPKGSRLDDPEQSRAARAAAEHRWDVVGADGMAQLQRAAGNSGVTAAMAQDEERSPVHDVVTSGGRPLEPEVRSDMETRLGNDFGDVRVHDDGHAHESAVAVNAHAYTVGSNIVFQRDRYDPSSADGQMTLAHELTHVVQQRNGPVDGSPAEGGIKVSDPGDRFEREASATAAQAMSAPVGAAVQREAVDAPAGTGPVVQREGEDEEEVQGHFIDAPVQREGEEEEAEDVPAG